MNLLRKKAGNQPQTKIQKRVSKISTPDLIAWSENALFVIGKELTAYQRSSNKDLLAEADMGAEALYAITQELKKRSKDD